MRQESAARMEKPEESAALEPVGTRGRLLRAARRDKLLVVTACVICFYILIGLVRAVVGAPQSVGSQLGGSTQEAFVECAVRN